MARLRSHSKAMEAEQNDQPITHSRKRRSSIALHSPQKPSKDATTAPEQQSALMKTPSKPKKKVRFSDPGPESSSMGSTGITPFVARTSLLPGMDAAAPQTPRYLNQPPRRRASLPTISTSAELGTPMHPIEVHDFIPYREQLTPRVTRQLRRRNMSEELNAIEADRRSEAKLMQEVQRLKDELALARQLGAGLADNEESVPHSNRILELENELVALKQEHSQPRDAEVCMSTETNSIDLIESGYGSNSASPSPDAGFTIDTNFCSPIRAPAATSTSAQPSPTTSTASAQTDITSQSLTTLHAYASSQTAHVTRARLALEHLYPGETPIGLSPTGDAAPLLDAILNHLRSSKASLAISQAALAASQAQESNIRAKFNTSLRQLEEARAQHASLLRNSQQISSTQHAQAQARIAELEAEAKQQDRSHQMLTKALEKYREDVRGLEALVQELECEHASAMKKMREETEEKVADLECAVAAETSGRREAEAESDENRLQLKVAEDKVKELRAAMGEKQAVVRELEEEMEVLKEGCEREVGGLNVRVGELSAALSAAKADASRAEMEVRRLVVRVELEKEAGRQGIEALKADIVKCAEEADKVRTEYALGAEARGEEAVRLGGLGLLTPTVEGGRFRDVGVGAESIEGRVEMARGKGKRRKVDSGIGMLLEDGDEE